MADIRVDGALELQSGNTELAGVEQLLYGYTSAAVVEVRDWLQVTSTTNGRKQKIRALHKGMSIILSQIEEICF